MMYQIIWTTGKKCQKHSNPQLSSIHPPLQTQNGEGIEINTTNNIKYLRGIDILYLRACHLVTSQPVTIRETSHPSSCLFAFSFCYYQQEEILKNFLTSLCFLIRLWCAIPLCHSSCFPCLGRPQLCCAWRWTSLSNPGSLLPCC